MGSEYARKRSCGRERMGKATQRRRGFHRRETGSWTEDTKTWTRGIHCTPEGARSTEAAGPRAGVFPPRCLLLGCPIAHPALWGTFLIILLTTCPGDPIQKTGQGEESCPRPTREERANQGAVLMVCLAFIHRRVRSSQRKEILCLEPGVRVRLVLQARDSRHTKQPGTNFRLILTGLGSMVSDVARSLLKSTV